MKYGVRFCKFNYFRDLFYKKKLLLASLHHHLLLLLTLTYTFLLETPLVSWRLYRKKITRLS